MAATSYPTIRVLLEGESGTGKSTFANTFPGPRLVELFDPPGKGQPYLESGIVSDVKQENDILYQEVVSEKTRNVITRVEYFSELSLAPESATAYERFLKRAATLDHDLQNFRTLIFDSATYFELAARKHSEYHLNRGVKDVRQHYGLSRHECEEWLMRKLPSLLFHNVVVIAHLDLVKNDVTGELLRLAAVPGKLANSLGAGYGEVYRTYTQRDPNGVTTYWLQTRSHEGYNCSSLIKAEYPCVAHYKMLWENYTAPKIPAKSAKKSEASEEATLPEAETAVALTDKTQS
jgi:hypothetical protein